jgi:hypothetical protein
MTMYERLIPQDFPMALAINLISGEELRKMCILEIFFGSRLFYL